MKHAAISPIVEVLLQARADVEANWCQGFGQEGQVCALQALWNTKIGRYEEAGSFLIKALPQIWAVRGGIITYNDDKTTTKADILALYDRAIELALA